MPFLPQPKPRAAALEKQDRRLKLERIDERESVKVRRRSGGQCEVVEIAECWPGTWRCTRRAEHVMHLIGGRGRRGVGISALQEHKLHGCAEHHREIDGGIGGKRLKRIGGVVPVYSDPYRRVR